MSYLVLARKWRPTGFEEVVGQEHITRTLSNAIRMDRVAHAFLFTGARGVGKTSTARIFAKALNCAKGPTPEPCGECASCLEVPAGTSIDVFEIDGASNRGIGEIRELREGIKYAPSRDRYKLYIIDEVHMLTQEAFNALLKTLEEPPGHVKFIFATTEPQKIPVTILSRCQRFDFKRVPSSTLTDRIRQILEAEGVHMDAEALHIVARESEGSMRDALSLLDRLISFAGAEVTGDQVREILGVADRRWLHGLVIAILSSDAGRAIEVVGDVHQYGFDLQHFATELARFLRDMLVIRVSGAGERLTDLSPTEYQALVELGGRRGPDDLLAIFRVALRAAEEVAHSRFPKLALEMAVIRMAGMRPLQPLDDLLLRLEELERKLPEGFVVPSDGTTSGPRAEATPLVGGRPALRVVPPPIELPRPSAQPVARTNTVAAQAPPPVAGQAHPPVTSQAQPSVAAQAHPPVAAQAHSPVAAQAHPATLAHPASAPAMAPHPEPVAAPSARAVEPRPLTQSAIPGFEAWLSREDPPLSGELAQARLTVAGESLEVGFKSDLFLSRFQGGSPAAEKLEALTTRYFGEAARVLVHLVDRGTETTFERRERERAARMVQRREEAQRHPLVETVVGAFDGRVRTVRVHEIEVPDEPDELEA